MRPSRLMQLDNTLEIRCMFVLNGEKTVLAGLVHNRKTPYYILFLGKEWKESL